MKKESDQPLHPNRSCTMSITINSCCDRGHLRVLHMSILPNNATESEHKKTNRSDKSVAIAIAWIFSVLDTEIEHKHFIYAGRDKKPHNKIFKNLPGLLLFFHVAVFFANLLLMLVSFNKVLIVDDFQSMRSIIKESLKDIMVDTILEAAG
jgi:hypothetical protein